MLGYILGAAARFFRRRNEIREIRDYLRGAHQIELRMFQVIGSYYRYDRKALGDLRAVRDRVLGVFRQKSWKARNNFLVWGPAGQGKSSFVKEMCRVAEGQYSVRGFWLDLREDDLVKLGRIVEECRQLTEAGHPVVISIDECDHYLGQPSQFEIIHGPLEWNVRDGRPVVWILIGSGVTKKDLIERIQGTQFGKGPDALRRIHEDHVVIPRLTAADKVIIAAGRARQLGFVRAERIALMTFAMDPTLNTPGEISRRLERLRGDVTLDAVLYTHLLPYMFPFRYLANKFYEENKHSVFEPLEEQGFVDVVPPPADL